MLVERLQRQDEAAWRTFIDQYGRLIYAVGARLGLTEDERDDMFQNTCVACVRAIERLRDPAKLSGWLYGVAYRQGVDLLRRRSDAVSTDDALPGGEVADALLVEAEAQDRLERLEDVGRLHDALALLEERCRRLLTAVYLEEPKPSYGVISERESMPIGSIGPTRARCMEKLQKAFEKVSGSGG